MSATRFKSAPSPRLLAAAVLLLLAVGAWPGFAQNYVVDKFVLSGGGGTSTNAQLTLTGTIGQPDAGVKQTAGSLVLEGGFWSVTVAIQTTGAPLLSITRVGGNVQVSWPVESSGYVLEVTGSLRAPVVWVPVFGVANNSVSTPASPGTSFFRLRRL